MGAESVVQAASGQLSWSRKRCRVDDLNLHIVDYRRWVQVLTRRENPAFNFTISECAARAGLALRGLAITAGPGDGL